MGIPVVDELGDAVEQAWSSQNYLPDCFPDLSVEHLLRARLPDRLDPNEIVDWALRGNLPQQADRTANFGQPPITLFRSRRFFVAALFWVDGTTSIHDHSFSGAFQLLSGSSIETRFSFERSLDVAAQLQLGRLEPNQAMLVERGDAHQILSGPKFIHSLFHLSRPSISLVVRTYFDVDPGIQLRYLPPGIAYNSFFDDASLDRMVQVVDMLRSTEDSRFVEKTGALIARSDLHTAFSVIKSCLKLSNRATLSELIGRVSDPMAAQLFTSWAAETERVTFLQSRRAFVHEPALRFLLAVLLNSHRRQDALKLVASYAKDTDPAEQTAAWLAKLSTVNVRLQVGAGAWEPNLLGLPAFSPDLERILATELKARCGSDVDTRQNENTTSEAKVFLGKLRTLPALAPLFR